MSYTWTNIANGDGAQGIRNKLNGLGTEVQTLGTTKGNTETLTFTNVAVAVNSWVSSATYTDYPYQAVISCTGVDSTYIPSVVFDVTEATSGSFAPVSTSGANSITIYANAIPSAAITIPTITGWKGLS
jgi:hypothetical protein